ncbi:MAG TPA: tRNA 2-thiouridine(34) synthase MnmA [Thermodesulfovibrionales bacterium]|jgi:tRNA-specific 2-thiouridylase|nr:tRNA 2-thiouridine(34) synthase MnmA [Thermodesulfovibrionales bacterium]
MPKVIAGMSGGVDSSVAAYLLKEKGYEVEGISFLMWEKPKGTSPACCSLRAVEETAKTARQIGIPHDVIDVRDDFAEKVITPFVHTYISGLTPNPCILCNRHIKFPYLIKEAEKRGAEYVSTGHYARVERQDSRLGESPGATRIQGAKDSKIPSALNLQPSALLKKGVDTKKDQSYVLYILTEDILRRLILPLGDYTKNAVREIAEKLGLVAAKRAESQEICFIQERNYLTFIQKISPVEREPGPIVDSHGKIIGTHKGIHGYTIGQRKGLGIASPEPLYVVDIDIQKNTVYAGPRDSVKKKEFYVHELNWLTPPPPPLMKKDKEGLEKTSDAFRATVKVRSTMKDEPAMIFFDPASFEIVRVVFDEPQWAPAPGQSAVFYDNDIVIGGGIIALNS